MTTEVPPYLFGDAAELVGRDSELAAARRFLLTTSRVGGTSLLLWGDPGVGKTALLSAVGRIAVDDGFRLLFAQGTEFEAEVSYAGLQQLLLPVWREVEQTPARHLEALQVALGFSVAEPPPVDLVVAATARVLSSLAEDRPVLMAVDDVDWLDRATARVLGGVARHWLTGHARIGFLFTTRADHAVSAGQTGAAALQVCPLADLAAESLLAASFPGLDRDLRRRVLSLAAGNPLALMELARSSGSGLLDEFDVAPLSTRLLETFGSRLETLDAPARRLMLLAALDGGGGAAAVTAASPESDMAEQLQRAAQAGLARWEDGRGVRFRHPLTARVVVQQATAEQVRDAHRARGQLVVGAYLRRHNAVAGSREYLSAAEEAFTGLGAVPWARRAAEELAATAAVRQPAREGGFAALTPQQGEIAELAARGMSNKQIAQRLNISPRTVGNHLYQVFPKLGVRSRAGLRDALNGSDR